MRKKIKISETLLVASTPLFGYILAFFYEIGYANAVGIPQYLIIISLTQILIASLAIISLAISLLFFWNCFYRPSLSSKPLRKIKQLLLRISPFIFILSAYIFIFGEKWEEWILILFIFLIFLFIEFIFPLISQWKIKGYSKKLEAHLDASYNATTIFNIITDFLITKNFRFYIPLAFVLILANPIGRSAALNQRYIYYHKNNPNLVLLRKYGDVLISAHYDPKTKCIKNELVLQKLSDSNPLSLVEMEIEGLVLEEIKYQKLLNKKRSEYE